MKILLVDDDNMIQKAVTTICKKINYELEIAPDGKDAIALCSAGATFDVILMDKTMQEVGGLEATKAIRGLSNGSQYTILLVSGDEISEEEWKSFGFDGFLLKPVGKSAIEGLAKYKK